MVAGDLTVHREVDVQENYGSPVGSQSQFDMTYYTGELITLKVRDLEGLSSNGSFLFTVPEHITLSEFVHDVGVRFNVPSNQFDLVYQDLKRGEIHEFSTYPPQERLSVFNIKPNPMKEYAVTLERRKVKRVVKSSRNVVRRLDAELAAVAPDFQDTPQLMAVDQPIILSSPRAGTSHDMTLNIGREFVGLKNMTMTCYLNSLIQSLFFTPEFRNAVYMYQYVDDIKKKKSIAFALQKLFLQLQFSVRDSIGTEELTNTFGWKGEEVWIQHDIEELYRLLMEHLSEEFKSTPLQGILPGLYGGILNDYVECLECKNRNCKEELFLALPLPVRVFGSPLNAPTLEEALRSFIVPEILDDKNQYNCERCQKPCDAKKGFSFKKLPYILTIALKRFEFNWERLTRHKLNDKVIFPMVLDMNDMVDSNIPVTTKTESDLVPPVQAELIKSKDDGVKRDVHSRPCVNLDYFTKEADEGIEVETCSSPVNGETTSVVPTPNLEEMISKGPNVYQLYAIMIHRGGVSGGHYFAFIRDFETGQWYRFDDTTVRRISDQDIQGTYGGADTYLDGLGKDLGVAYMLVYRRYDPQLNALPMTYDIMNPHIKEMWDSMRELDKNVHNREELDRNTVRMNVYLRIPGTTDVLDYREMTLLKANTMSEAALGCYNEFFKGESVIPADRVRLVRFDRDLSIIENSFDGKDDEIVCIALKSPSSVTKLEGLLLEMREPNEVFESYRQDDIVFNAHMVRTETEEFVQTKEIHIQPDQTVATLRKKLALTFQCQENEIIMLVHKPERETAPMVLLGDEKNDMAVRSFCFPRVSNLYLECFVPGADPSNFIKFLNNFVLSYCFDVKIQIPTTNQLCLGISEETAQDLGEGEGVFPMDTPVLTPEVIIAPISPSAFQYSDGEVVEESDGMQEFEAASALGRDCTSDPSTSEDSSLTGSDRTLVVDTDTEGNKISSLQSSPTKSENLIESPTDTGNQQVVGSQVIPECKIGEIPTEGVDETNPENMEILKKKYYFRIVADKTCDDGEWRIVNIRVDRNIPLTVLSSLLKDISGVDEKRFIMSKVYNGCDFEVVNFSSRLNSLAPLDEIKCVLGHRLQKGEGRVSIYVLQMDHQPLAPVYLKDVVLHESMTTGQIKDLIAREIKTMNLSIDTNNTRIRKKTKNGPARIFKNHQTVGEILGTVNGNELFYQVMETPDPDNVEGHHSMFIRRWSPTEYKLGPTQEVLIEHDFTRPAHELVLDKLGELLDIKRENLQVAKPENHGSFPYLLNPLVVHERLSWFSIQTRLSSQRSLYLYSDELFLFIRDRSEPAKQLSVEERQELEKGLESSSGDVYDFTASPRREMGLIINLARTPPT